MNKHLIVVCGATASGKTKLAIQLAIRFKTEIISADSRQFYKEIPIGSAAPSAIELEEVPHHFIAFRSIKEQYNAGLFEQDVIILTEKLFQKHNILIMAGGSGMYIQAVCNGMDGLPDTPPEIRDGLNQLLKEKGLDFLLKQLEGKDIEYFRIVDKSNPQRVIRALELCHTSGSTYTSLRKGERKSRNFNVIKIGINIERPLLYERINQRTDAMLAAGLESEARNVFDFRNNNAVKTVGYKEMFDYFEGKTTMEEAIRLIKQNTRRFAKRQLTWFRKDEEIQWFDGSDLEGMIEYIKTKTE